LVFLDKIFFQKGRKFYERLEEIQNNSSIEYSSPVFNKVGGS